MDQVEKSAVSVEEAIEAALRELGVSEQQAKIEILKEPRAGFLGLKAQPALVRVTAAAAPPTEEESDQEVLAAVDFLEETLSLMQVDAEVEVQPEEDSVRLNIVGNEEDDVALLIGKHGQTLEALQELARAVAHRAVGRRSSVVVDVEGYRERRRSRLDELVRDAAAGVRKTGRPRALGPFRAHERKMIHQSVAAWPDLESLSQGDEPNRKVVIRRKR